MAQNMYLGDNLFRKLRFGSVMGQGVMLRLVLMRARLSQRPCLPTRAGAVVAPVVDPVAAFGCRQSKLPAAIPAHDTLI